MARRTAFQAAPIAVNKGRREQCRWFWRSWQRLASTRRSGHRFRRHADPHADRRANQSLKMRSHISSQIRRVDEMAGVEALIFKKWCFDRASSPECALEFSVSIIEMQPGEPRENWGALANTLRQIQ